MGEVIHPADEIPGGLWRGACARPIEPQWENRYTVTDARLLDLDGVPHVEVMSQCIDDGHGRHIRGGDAEAPVAKLALILPGPLGLGLAGLAARVAERLSGDSYASCLLSGDLGERPFRDHLEALDWFPGAPQHEAPNPWYELTAAASYLAYTDRLCALVGLALAPGEVARWEYEGDTWTLSSGCGVPVTFCFCCDGPASVDGLADLDPDDGLEALRVCVAALEAHDE